ncbi:inositol-pentakisphosphate 2-kinase isoform X2 [Hetaerina americana]|uniref:inositol-pentakisphosphate 2-kinase isoform X2 n=1 Tax=Hetaerina americana TaxID=62018 RepID=UPI003A7F354F
MPVMLSMDHPENALKSGVEDVVANENEPPKGSIVKPVRFPLHGKKWTYRGEGNANVVIALPQERKVVRLRKSNAAGIYSPGESATFFLEENFYLKVMIPLLGACYVKPPIIVSIDGFEILEIEAQLAHQRPVFRRHKTIRMSDAAALYMDFTLLPFSLSNESTRSQRFPTYCVEIKPKQGWVPKADRQLHKCIFCLHQYLKVMTGKVESLSRYCPLDLFSGNYLRMKKALCALLETPQNNLQIFQDGNIVYSQEVNGSLLPILKSWFGGPTNVTESKKLLDKFYFVIIEALLRDMTSIEGTYEVIGKGMPSCDKFLEGKNGCRGVKMSLDTLCIEPSLSSEEGSVDEDVDLSVERIPNGLLRTAKEVAVQALNMGKEYSCNWEDDDLLSDNCVLQRILNVQKMDAVGANGTYKAYHQEESLVGASANFSFFSSLMDSACMLSPIHRYLLAATAKDCSIMLAFQEDYDGRCKPSLKQHILQCPDGQRFIFNVGVIDLEPKPISCIEKHARRDFDVYNAYVNWHLC